MAAIGRVKVVTRQAASPALVEVLTARRERVARGSSPAVTDLHNEDREESEATAEWIVEWMTLTSESGEVSFHVCPHTEGEAPSIPCTDPSTGFRRWVI